jgi:hypothetical protein
MFYKFFNNSKPFTVIVILVIIVATSIASSIFFFRNSIDITFTIPLTDWTISSAFSIVLSTAIILLIAFIYQKFLRRFKVISGNSFALFFFAITLGIDQLFFTLNEVLIAYLFIVFAIENLLGLSHESKPSLKLFNAGFLIGIAALIYPYMVIYMILVYTSIVIFGNDGWKNWIMPIFGFIVTYYLLFTYLYVFDNVEFLVNRLNTLSFNWENIALLKNKQSALAWMIIFGMTLWSTKDYSMNSSRQKIEAKKAYTLNYLSLLVGVFVIVYGNIKTGAELIIILFPIAAIWAKYLQHVKKKWAKDIYFYLVILAITISHILF